MKATVSITDEHGNRYEGSLELALVEGRARDSEDTRGGEAEPQPDLIDYALPLRAFVRTYAAGNSGGAARLVVLLAFLAKGSESADVPAETVRLEWGRLTAHLGAFNRAHVTRAKDRAWLDSPNAGVYRLGPRWREAFDLG